MAVVMLPQHRDTLACWGYIVLDPHKYVVRESNNPKSSYPGETSQAKNTLVSSLCKEIKILVNFI